MRSLGLPEVLIIFLAALVFAVYLSLVVWVYRDARRRGMRALLWALLALLMPSAVGFILYFILREPLKRPCPQCGAPARGEFAFCPSCGATLGRACPQCRKAVEPGWSHCAHCGAALTVAEPQPRVSG